MGRKGPVKKYPWEPTVPSFFGVISYIFRFFSVQGRVS